MDGTNLNSDQLATLLTNYPKNEELLFYTQLPSSEGLQEADIFCYEVARQPLLRCKIEILVLRATLPNEISTFDGILGSIIAASNALTENFDSSIKNLLFKTLQCGNFLNQVSSSLFTLIVSLQNTFAASAAGFALNSLIPTLTAKGKRDAQNLRMVDLIAESTPELRELTRLKPVLHAAM